MITSIITVVVNVILDILLVTTKLDYMGLALATTLAITLNAIMLFVMLEKRFGSLKKRKWLVTFIKSLLSLILPVIACSLIIGNLYSLEHNVIINLLVLAFAVLVSGILYLLTSYLLKMDETKFIFEQFLKIKNDRKGAKNEK